MGSVTAGYLGTVPGWLPALPLRPVALTGSFGVGGSPSCRDMGVARSLVREPAPSSEPVRSRRSGVPGEASPSGSGLHARGRGVGGVRAGEGAHPVTVVVVVILQAVQGAHVGVPTHPQLRNRTLNTEGQRSPAVSERWQGHRGCLTHASVQPGAWHRPQARSQPGTQTRARGARPVDAQHSRKQRPGT